MAYSFGLDTRARSVEECVKNAIHPPATLTMALQPLWERLYSAPSCCNISSSMKTSSRSIGSCDTCKSCHIRRCIGYINKVE